MRLLFPLCTIGLITALWPATSSPAWAGLAQILFDTRPEQLAQGGAAVPGAITGTAEVRQPTSLAEASGGLLRLNHIRERTLNWHRYGRRIGGAEGRGWTEEFIWPLDRNNEATRWYVGIESENFSSSADYDRIRPGRKDACEMSIDSRVRRAALLYRVSGNTSLGLGWAAPRYDVSGLVLRWRKLPQPPSPMDEFPFALDLDAEHKTIAVQHQVQDRRWGVGYSKIQADNLFGVTIDENNYWAQCTGQGDTWRAYYRSGEPRQCYFMHGWQTDITADGPTLAGRMLRGEHNFQFTRRGVRAGRRVVSDGFESQVTFEYDRSFGALDGYIDTDLLPFPLGKRQGLDSWGSLRTFGLRYGGGEQISSEVRLLWGLSLLRSHGRLHYTFKRRDNPFRPMEYLHVGYYNANFTGGNVAVGLRYADVHGWRITGVVSFLGGQMRSDSRTWSDSLQPPPPPPPTPPAPPGPPHPQPDRTPQLHPSYILGLSIERRF